MIRFLARPGDVVRKGQPLAKIVNAFGRHMETVTALDDALVLGHTDSSAAFPGMPIMAFGIAEREKDQGMPRDGSVTNAFGTTDRVS